MHDELNALVDRKVLFRVTNRFRKPYKRNDTFNVIHISEDQDLISSYESLPTNEDPETGAVSRFDQDDGELYLKDSVGDNDVADDDVETPLPKKRTFVVLDDDTDNEEPPKSDGKTKFSANKGKGISVAESRE